MNDHDLEDMKFKLLVSGPCVLPVVFLLDATLKKEREEDLFRKVGDTVFDFVFDLIV